MLPNWFWGVKHRGDVFFLEEEGTMASPFRADFSAFGAGRCLRWVGLATFPGALDSFSAIFSRLHTSQPASSLCFDKRQSL